MLRWPASLAVLLVVQLRCVNDVLCLGWVDSTRITQQFSIVCWICLTMLVAYQLYRCSLRSDKILSNLSDSSASRRYRIVYCELVSIHCVKMHQDLSRNRPHEGLVTYFRENGKASPDFQAIKLVEWFPISVSSLYFERESHQC